MSQPCELCGGIGLIRVDSGAAPCPCQVEAKAKHRLKIAAIPSTFHEATLDNYQVTPGTQKAVLLARRFIEEFVPGQTRMGLLFTGPVGLGKTHLATGIVRELVTHKGADARFADVRQLLERIRSSFDADSKETQFDILRPFYSASLVVIDELGAERRTEWVGETVDLLIGGLYNAGTCTIVTTNYPNAPVGGWGDSAVESGNSFARGTRRETLGDRIGARMYSRLQQMCKVIEMTGPDWRINGGQGAQKESGPGAPEDAKTEAAHANGTGAASRNSPQQPRPVRTGHGRSHGGDADTSMPLLWEQHSDDPEKDR